MPQISDTDLRDIQGLVARFNKDHEALILIQFGPADAARRLLEQLGPVVANAWEVRQFNDLFSEIRARTDDEPTIEATWSGLGISAHGYGALGVQLAELGSSEGANAFRAGMAARSNPTQTGDQPQDQPPVWLEPFREAGIDAVLVVASDRRESLDHALDTLNSRIQDNGCLSIFQARGDTLPPPLTGHEHFGFKDGVSQPIIDGFDTTPPAAGEPPAIPAGEFILGYPDHTGSAAQFGDLWNHGTFSIFRRLRQDVAAFRAQSAAMATATSPTLTADQVSADLVGRWPSGSPLALIQGTDPGPTGLSNAFDFSDDPSGANTPRFAHIRKVNPRNEARSDQQTDPAQDHRMLRVGIPYGDPLAPGAPDDEADRGLLFLALVADLDQQFEFVQRNWADNPNFPNGGAPPGPNSPYSPPPPGTPSDGVDPIIGAHNRNDTVSLNQANTIHSLPLLAETIRVTAGEYFFCPAISAIQALASGATASTPPPASP